MQKDRTYQMTKGSEIKALLVFALPMLIGNIFQQLYNMVDSSIVGLFVGARSLAAVGASGCLSWLFFALCAGLSTGIGIIVSQHFGAGQTEQVKTCIANAFYLVGVVGTIMSIVSVLNARFILKLLNTPPEILDEAVTYFSIICAAIVVVALCNVVVSILRALGDSRTPLMFLIFSCVLNIFLDLLFVCVFHWGSKGAAIATVVAEIVSMVLGLSYAFLFNPYFKLKKEDWKLQMPIIIQGSKLGIPLALQSGLIAVSCIVLQGVVNSFGQYVIAAFTAATRVEELIQQSYNSVEVAVSTFTGQNIGGKRLDRVKTGYHKSILIIIVFAVLMLLIMQTLSHSIMGLFVHEQEVIEIGAVGLCITSICYFPLGMIYVTRGLLNGAGDAKYALMCGMMEVLMRVGCSMLFVRIPAIGINGIWYTSCVTWIIVAVFSLLRYKQGKWKTFSLIKPAIVETVVDEKRECLLEEG